MRLETYLEGSEILSEGVLQSALKKIANQPINTLKNMFRKNWAKLVNLLKDRGKEEEALRIINKNLKTNFKNLDMITRQKPKETGMLEEDFANYWKLIKQEAFPTLAFYPALKIWLEIDKMLIGTDASVKIIIVYAAFWLLLVSGKFVKSWNLWRKNNPGEFEKEGSKKNPFAA